MMGADKADVLIDCIVVMMSLIALLSSILLKFLDTYGYMDILILHYI